jgi:hypothetical protein
MERVASAQTRRPGAPAGKKTGNAAVQQVNLDLTDAADFEHGCTLDLACLRNSTVYSAV